MGSSCSTFHHASTQLKMGQRAIVIIPGMASNALESRMMKNSEMLQREGGGSSCPELVDFLGGDSYLDWEVSYLNVHETILHGPRTFRSLVLRLATEELSRGEVLPCTESDGSEVRVMKGLDGIATLNPGEYPPVKLWEAFIEAFENKYGLMPLNYDWRRWGDPVFAHEVLGMFQEHVETASLVSGLPVTLVAHSMGACVTLWSLAHLGAAWQEKFVDQVILCAPAATGAPCMFPCYANGPGGAAGLSMLKLAPIEHIDNTIANVTSSWPCMVSEFPTKVGDVNPYPPEKVFAVLGGKKYTCGNVGEFLEDVRVARLTASPQSPTWKIGTTMWPHIQRMNSEMRAPAVATHIIYSKTEKTLQRVNYDAGSLVDQPTIEEFEPGDDTITAESIETLAQAWVAKGHSVTLHPTPAEEKANHQTCISCDFALKVVRNLMEHRYMVEGNDVDMDDADDEPPSIFSRLQAMRHHYM